MKHEHKNKNESCTNCPKSIKECDCEEISCKENCERKHTHKGFWCEKCHPERYTECNKEIYRTSGGGVLMCAEKLPCRIHPQEEKKCKTQHDVECKGCGGVNCNKKYYCPICGVEYGKKSWLCIDKMNHTQAPQEEKVAQIPTAWDIPLDSLQEEKEGWEERFDKKIYREIDFYSIENSAKRERLRKDIKDFISKELESGRQETIKELEDWIHINSHRVKEGKFVWTKNLLKFLKK